MRNVNSLFMRFIFNMHISLVYLRPIFTVNVGAWINFENMSGCTHDCRRCGPFIINAYTLSTDVSEAVVELNY